jgi:hypothetical protein
MPVAGLAASTSRAVKSSKHLPIIFINMAIFMSVRHQGRATNSHATSRYLLEAPLGNRTTAIRRQNNGCRKNVVLRPDAAREKSWRKWLPQQADCRLALTQ